MLVTVRPGDKDTFRVAWMATRTPYALPSKHVGLVGYTSGVGIFGQEPGSSAETWSSSFSSASSWMRMRKSKRGGDDAAAGGDDGATTAGAGAAANTLFNGHAMLQHHHTTGAPVFLHRNQRKWDPRVLNEFPPAGWDQPRVLAAVKTCGGATLTDADVPPAKCVSSFSVPAMLSDMPSVHAVPLHDVLSWDVEVRAGRGGGGGM